MKMLARILLPFAMLGLSSLATAASWDDDRGRGNREFKQEYWDGDCKVKREAKKDGEYKEERECKGARRHARHGEGREYKQEYWDGNCKVKREAKKDGEYKEERECKGPRFHARDTRPYHQSGYTAEAHGRQEPSVRVDVRVRQ